MPGYNSHMGCTYSPMDYASPDAVTLIAKVISSSTYQLNTHGLRGEKPTF
jgi:hypothetical protein